MRKLYYALLLSLMMMPVAHAAYATAVEGGPSLAMGPGVAEKLEALGAEFTLDWGLYQDT